MTPARTSSSRASQGSSRSNTSPVQSRINGDQADLLADPYASPPHTGEADSDVGTSLQQLQQQQQQHTSSGDVDHGPADMSMQDWDDSAWDDSLFGLDHPLLGANVYNYLNVSKPLTTHQDSVERAAACSTRWPVPSQQPVAENTAALAMQRVPQQASKEPSAQRQGCDCLGALVKVLENVGKSQTQTEWTGIDMQLMSLWQAMHICHQVVACNACSTCSDSPVLVATIIQLFAGISEELGSICGRPRDGSPADVIGKEEEIAVGAVWIGRYRLENLAMRLPLVREVVVMHLTEMTAILKKLRERLGPRQEVRQQAAEAEQKAREICNIIRAVIREEVN